MIPDDLEFWNHAFWVIPNPELIQRFIPPGLGIYENSKGEYFVMEHIPF